MYRELRREELRKHYGPGNHKSGSPQSVHGGKKSTSSSAPNSSDRSPRMLHARLKVEGGFTVKADTEAPTPTIGYMVSYKGQKVIPATKITARDIAAFRASRTKLLHQPDNFFGAWVDGETGLAYLDVSRRFMDKTKAHEFGMTNDQLEGYDLETGETFGIRRIKRSDSVTKSGGKFTYVPLDMLTDEEAARAIRDAADD